MLAPAATALGALLVSPFLPAPLAPLASAQVPFNEVRALNFARQAGVRLNGGLTLYHPQACMFTTSAATNPCLVRSDAQGFTYRFLGGPPGWQIEGSPATVETELFVSPDGTSLVQVIYNGPPRSR
ncbi:MAG: hypothetical protein ACKOBY_01685 [Cyanobium sp.]